MKISVEGQIAPRDWYRDPEDEESLISSVIVDSGFGGGRVKELFTLPPEGAQYDKDERNDFRADVVILSATEKEETETDPEVVVLRCGAFTWKDEIIPFDMIVRNPAGMKYFMDLDISASNPLYTGIRGKLNFTKTKVVRVTESAFGDDAVDTYERNIKEWTLINANKVPYEYAPTEDEAAEEGALVAADIAKAIQNRNIHLAEERERARQNAAKNTAFSAAPAAPSTPVINGGFTF